MDDGRGDDEKRKRGDQYGRYRELMDDGKPATTEEKKRMVDDMNEELAAVEAKGNQKTREDMAFAITMKDKIAKFNMASRALDDLLVETKKSQDDAEREKAKAEARIRQADAEEYRRGHAAGFDKGVKSIKDSAAKDAENRVNTVLEAEKKRRKRLHTIYCIAIAVLSIALVMIIFMPEMYKITGWFSSYVWNTYKRIEDAGITRVRMVMGS